MADLRKTPLPCTVHDPELWWPIGVRDEGTIALAKHYCGPCPIKEACLNRALATGEPGVWGGTTEDERRAMKRGGHRRSMDAEEARLAVNRALASA